MDGKSQLYRILRWPLRLLPDTAVVRVVRGPLRGARWVAGSANAGHWLGTFEVRKMQAFVDAIRPGDVVYDVGAHVGLYTLLAARGAGGGGHVVAFEPSPRNLAHLARHCALNHAANVRIVAAAVSDLDGQAAFDTGPNSFMGHLARDGAAQVRSIRLDDFVLAQESPPPHLVKMDIEGAEFQALRGAQETLRRHRPTIFLATHGAAVHAACCEFLASLSYELRPLTGDRLDGSDELVALAP